MPTKKRRVGFIPRSDVLDLINKLSFESNLSISKIINILVEEALQKRGIFDTKENNLELNKAISNKNKFNNELTNNYLNNDYLERKQFINYAIDPEIYGKFLMFLQFQENMKKNKI